MRVPARVRQWAFSENSTFLITDRLAHTPKPLAAQNFGVRTAGSRAPAKHERYIFQGTVPGPLAGVRTAPAPSPNLHQASDDPGTLAHARLHPRVALAPERGRVAVLPGWAGPHDDFASGGAACTFEFQAGDVGFVLFAAAGHYVENTRPATLSFLEMFKIDSYADVSLNQWIRGTPHEIVCATLDIDEAVLASLSADKRPVLPRNT